MKTRIILAMLVLLSSCTKTAISTNGNDTAAAADAANAVTAGSPDAMLTAHPWMYQAFYMHYVDENHKGDPLYVRGATNNPDEIIGTDRFLFRANHHFIQKEGQYMYKGTWHFTGNIPSFLVMTYDWGTDEDSVIIFDSKHLNFSHAFGYHGQEKSYTELVTAVR